MNDHLTKQIDGLYKKSARYSKRLLEYNMTVDYIVKHIAKSREEKQTDIELLRTQIMNIIKDGLF